MRIIGAIDIIEGECVRLVMGDFLQKKSYSSDPLYVALQMEEHGIRYLHLVDLDGARNKKIINHRVLENITGNTSLMVDFGGGIRSDEDIKRAFDCGASQVVCGSIAVTDPHLFLEWLSLFGAEKIILGADFKNRKIMTGGWTLESENDVICFLKKYRSEGVIYTICTDTERDGMLTGPSTGIYAELCEIKGLNVIASGGIATKNDLIRLEETGCEGAIIGKAIYEGKITLKELSELC